MRFNIACRCTCFETARSIKETVWIRKKKVFYLFLIYWVVLIVLLEFFYLLQAYCYYVYIMIINISLLHFFL